MADKQMSPGVVHKVPPDLRREITGSAKALELWEDITPLARNEWICWVEEAKQLETRKSRIKRVRTELLEGMRRPCCWLGCIHRKDKLISPSVQSMLDKRTRTGQA